MPTRRPPKQDRPVPKAVFQVIERAETSATAQANSAGTLDQAVDGSESTDGHLPPPAYGARYGEIGSEKDGSGTSARVADDGRVNIRINQLNRRLSQIFTPALRQHIESAEESGPPPPPYIPPSLGGGIGASRTPPLNIVIHVVGSRGDVQPFVALGKVLKTTYGHRVRLATHPNFKHFVQSNGLEFFNIGGDPARLMAFMVNNPSLMPSLRSLASGDIGKRRKDVAEYMQGCWRSCYEQGDGMDEHAADSRSRAPTKEDSGVEAKPFVADCIIANPPSFSHIHCAEKLGVPLHIMFTMPYSPTQAFPHPLANIQSSNADPQLTNYLSYGMIEVLSWQGLGDIINRFRAKCLGLDPISLIWAPGMLQRLRVPHTYCWSPALIPKPKDWASHISVTGFSFLDLASGYVPSPELQTFLDAGEPPVYIGFGSIVLQDPDAMTKLIFEAVRKSGVRVLLSKGWGGLGTDELDVPANIFMLGNVPHEWLFKRVSCVVHHGGAGTTAAGLSAGRPTLVVPFFGDQPFWGAMVARAGAGPKPIPHKQLTVENLAESISFCLRPDTLERAKDFATTIAAERGSDSAAMSFHQFLEVDRLRCALAPSRAAVWRVRRTRIRLSAFAACTLANANLLSFNDLKLFRAQEYETDEGPWDPISGGFVAANEAFGGMAMGLAEIPSETLKALQLPFRSSRKQSQPSLSTSTKITNDPTLEATSTASLSAGSSPVTLNDDADCNSAGIHRRQTDVSSMTSTTTSNSGIDRDMLRHTGAHGSKGVGRLTKALVQSPMTLSMGLTKGCHNLPKQWGDETVRTQAQISDLRSGVRTAGKEFGLGWYDGVTGLVTQPWKGAQKDGAGGFVKGIGKGVGGFFAKPLAGGCGVLGYTMKGVHKEVQKAFGSNAQNFILASRTAQGYDDWLQSSQAEKQDVIDRWNLIYKYIKKRKYEEVIRDLLGEQQNGGPQAAGPSRDTTPVSTTIGSPDAGHESLTSSNALAAEEGSISAQTMAPESTLVQGFLHEETVVSVEPTRDRSHEAADNDAGAEGLHHASEGRFGARQPTDSSCVFQTNLQENRSHDQQPQYTNSSGSSVFELEGGSDEDSEELELPATIVPEATEHPKTVAGPSFRAAEQHAFDAAHLAGATGAELEAQSWVSRREKTTQEKTEEEIVLEYIKKQSLLETQNWRLSHRHTPEDGTEERELRRAIQLSIRDQ
ncbi:Sterol 3-beta-glucosyltransferase UGT80A2 [Cyphellophora attinorum]|uniref:Sterol 3-beta-glucosyltransferase UGT80A2 n=1 Tax=Cyphellophora attinorum TaxID=1664694 RepID=A0A0N1I0S6_9EURO|nr:Sterol 3-beta-glucosyltransferase UGT80A2 [Phialophora attinorum]KPI45216.1 Sterol 3-beta-glucosyltransferase UGT80A2 [Phialophora attinorum]